MEHDARKLSISENEEKYPIPNYTKYYEEEKIHVVPSTELIPDEYEHKDNSMGLVLIFYSTKDSESKEVVVNEFTDQGYTTLNVYELTTRDFILNKLREVAKQNNETKTCLIVFFLGMATKKDCFLLEENEQLLLKEIWLNFTADICPSFRNKPKIFIFHATKKPDVSLFDAREFVAPPKGAYNVPSEADMLIIYKRTENIPNVFISDLCNKIHRFGKRDDIIGLVTRTSVNDSRPLIISTLTRKFYVTKSEQRGYYYDLLINHESTIDELNNLRSTYSRETAKRNVAETDSATRSKTSQTKSKLLPTVKNEKTQVRRPWKP